MTTIDEALRDKNLLGAALDDASTWRNWMVVLRAAFGLRLNEEQRSVFKAVAGDREPPTARVQELWIVAGRRSGKTRMASAIASFIASIERSKFRLAPGETGVVLVLSAVGGSGCDQGMPRHSFGVDTSARQVVGRRCGPRLTWASHFDPPIGK